MSSPDPPRPLSPSAQQRAQARRPSPPHQQHQQRRSGSVGFDSACSCSSAACVCGASADYQGFNSAPSSPRHRKRRSRRISITAQSNSRRVLIVMVGLPARGKSYIAKKLCRYLTWRGHNAAVFNVGARRRALYSASPQPAPFFDPNNPTNRGRRDDMAMQLLEEALSWMATSGGQVAIFDATNSTKARRRLLLGHCHTQFVKVLFIESVCDDPDVLRCNCLIKVSQSPDYVGVPREEALADLTQRIAEYAKAYDPIDDAENVSYIKVINMRSKLVCNLIAGYLPRTIAFFLMHQHTDKKPVWMLRAGHSEELDSHGHPKRSHDTRHKTAQLSEAGLRFAKRLAEHVQAHEAAAERGAGHRQPFEVWTSTNQRARQTAQFLHRPITEWAELNMMDLGICDGWTKEEIREKKPDVFAAWNKDRTDFRFPGGESYSDVLRRLDTLVMDLESQDTPMLVVSHFSCLRGLYAYFAAESPLDLCDTIIPLHTIIKFTPSPYGWTEERVRLVAPEEEAEEEEEDDDDEEEEDTEDTEDEHSDTDSSPDEERREPRSRLRTVPRSVSTLL